MKKAKIIKAQTEKRWLVKTVVYSNPSTFRAVDGVYNEYGQRLVSCIILMRGHYLFGNLGGNAEPSSHIILWSRRFFYCNFILTNMSSYGFSIFLKDFK